MEEKRFTPLKFSRTSAHVTSAVSAAAMARLAHGDCVAHGDSVWHVGTVCGTWGDGVWHVGDGGKAFRLREPPGTPVFLFHAPSVSYK